MLVMHYEPEGQPNVGDTRELEQAAGPVSETGFGFVDLVLRARLVGPDTARTDHEDGVESSTTASTPVDGPPAGSRPETSRRPGEGQGADARTTATSTPPGPRPDRDPTPSPGDLHPRRVSGRSTGGGWPVWVRRRSRHIVVGVLVFLLAALVATALLAGSPGRSGSPGGAADAGDAARQWLGAWAPAGVVLSDDVFGTELRRAGWDQGRLTGPAACPAATCRPDWLVSTPGLRSDASVAATLADATLVAVFGSGDDLIEIRRSGAEPFDQAAAERQARTTVGQALAGLPRLAVDPGTRALLETGRTDPRLLAMLVTLAQRGELRLVDLPAVAGEDAAGQPRRQMRLAGPAVDGDALAGFFAAQRDPFQPAALTPTPDGLLVSYPPLAPPRLLDAFGGP